MSNQIKNFEAMDRRHRHTFETISIVRKLAVFAIGLFFLSVHAQDLASIPPFQSFVTDTVGMLDSTQRTKLESFLKDYESRTGSQIAVLLISSTAPEAIEQYSIRVADAWKLGRKGINDGVILIVAKDNSHSLRRLRIETGRGVQGTLTDAQSKRILQDIIAPHFQTNDYYGGLMAGVFAIASLLDREHLPAPAAAQADRGPIVSAKNNTDIAGYAIAAILILFCLGALVLVLYILFKIYVFFLFIKGKIVKPKSEINAPMKPLKRGRKKDSNLQNYGVSDSASTSSRSSDDGPVGSGGSFDGGGASGDW